MQKPTQPLVFPIKGLYESTGFDIQPPGTTNDALNVRAFDALAGRARGGRRSGTSKYTYQPVTAARKPVQNTVKAVEGAAYNPPFTLLAEDFQGYTAEVSPDMSPLWGMASILNEDTPSLSIWPAIWETTANGLVWRQSSSTTGGPFLSHLIPLMNDAEDSVTVTLRAKPDITTGNAGFGGADEPTGVGPFIRASPDLQNGFYANLTVSNVASNIVSLNIYRMDPTASQGYVRVANQSITLGGGAVVTTDCKITLWVAQEAGTTLTVRARLQWVGGGPSGANIDETIESTRTNTDTGTNVTLGQEGSGVGVFNPGVSFSSNPTFTAGTAFRTITQVDARYRTPPVRSIVAKWTAAESGLNRYYRPQGFVSLGDSRNSSADTSRFTIGADGYDSSSSSGGFIVDTTPAAFIDAGFGTPFNEVGLTRPWDANGPHDIEVVLSTPSDMVAGNANHFYFTFRANSATGDFVSVNVFTTIDNTASRGKSGRIEALQVDMQNGTGVLLNNAFPILTGAVFVEGSILRVEDHGSTFEVYLDGRVIATVSDTQSPTGLAPFTTAPTEVTGSYTLFTQQSNTGIGFRNLVSEVRWVRRGGSAFNAAGSTTSGRLLAVSGGDIVDITGGFITPIPTGVGVLVDDPFSIQSVSAFNSVFFTDGTTLQEYVLSTGVVGVPTATAGAFPALPRLVALYRGRLVWSGTAADPHNWFMSAVSNPFDYDYSPATPSETQAVAGNNSVAGLIGDVVNTLIPFDDDYMIFGCDHSIWRMAGDPAAGGVIDLVSDQTGMAFGSAWAKDPANTLYFWGNDGVYRLVSGETPQNLTKNRIDFRLRTVALDENRIFMAWNYLDAELIILIQPTDPNTPVRVIVWESRTDAWWEDVFPVAHGPSSILMYDSTAANDQAVLFGGRDGFIRKLDDSANDDDGTPITSRVRFSPFIAPSRTGTVLLNALYPVLANGSSTVTVNIYTGQTAEGCMTAMAPRASVVLAHAGRNALIRRSIRGYALQVEIEQTAGAFPWALESLTAEFDPSGIPTRHARVSGEGATGGG